MSEGMTILVALLLVIVLVVWAVLSDRESKEEKDYWTFLLNCSYFVGNCTVNEKNKNTIVNNLKRIKAHRLFEKKKFNDKFNEIYLIYKRRFFNAN
jgi:hypothetical protein